MELMEHPGRLYVVATLLPLASFLLLLLLGAVRNAARPYRQGGIGQTIYWAAGGDVPTKVGAYIATGAIGLSCILCVVGLVWFLRSHGVDHDHAAGHAHPHSHAAKADEHEPDEELTGHADHDEDWAERVTFLRVSMLKPEADRRGATELQLGYRIDHLS